MRAGWSTGEGWTSYARFADFAILLARSDPKRPKHRGITCFVLDMATPGIEVRPIRQMNGMAEFNQVFLSDVLVPDASVVGEVHDGWTVANAMLGSERGLAGADWPGSAEMVPIARRRGAAADSVVRQHIAEAFIGEEILRYLDLRVQTQLAHGAPVGALASIVNLTFADHLRRTGDSAAALVGPDIQVADSNTSPEGRWQFHLLTAPSVRIASGTDEIQRNILGERALGLPREPRPGARKAGRVAREDRGHDSGGGAGSGHGALGARLLHEHAHEGDPPRSSVPNTQISGCSAGTPSTSKTSLSSAKKRWSPDCEIRRTRNS